MRGKTTMDIVARHFLVGTDRSFAAPTRIAMPARDHGRHDDRTVDPPHGVGAGINDVAADLVSERQWQLMVGAHAIVIVAEIGMADAAARDLNEDFVLS